MIAMETNSGKALDETCNCLNELYRDELLYSSWIDRRFGASRASATAPVMTTGAPGLTLRRYTRKS